MENIREKAQAIRLLLLDIDGILTDGRIYYSNEVETLKSFHTQDGLGLKLLQQVGIQVGIISGKKADYLYQHLQHLNIAHIYLGYDNKLTAYEAIKNTLHCNDESIAYMGDDLMDLPILTRVGLSITVPDAHEKVQPYVDMITKRFGGKGAVREVCDLLLQTQGHYQAIMDAYLR